MQKQLFILSLMLISLMGISQNLVQWRGENRTGVYNETGILKQWPADGPKILWHYDSLGLGFSSPLILSDKIIITADISGTGYIYALDLKGNFLWKTAYGKEWEESWPGVRSTPTFMDGKIYINSSYGIASCFDANNGKLLWSIDLAKEYGAVPPKWGIVESPLIVDDKVIFSVGGKTTNIVAVNRLDGKAVWTSTGKGELTAYCSPLLIDYKGKKLICTLTAESVLGIDAETGTLLWSYPKTNAWAVHANTPVYKDGMIYVVSGYGSGGIMLKLADDCKSVSMVWTNTSLDNQMGGVVLLDGKIYGSGQKNKTWQCVDWNTGEMKYETKEIGKGVTIANDGLLYCYSDNGILALLKPGETSFEILSQTKVKLGEEYHWAHPVIENKILYVRHGNSLIAYSIAAE